MAKKAAGVALRKPNRYSAIIGTIFDRHYEPGKTQFEFSREEFVEIARSLSIDLPKNLGDTIYSFRFRTALPGQVVATAGTEREWIIQLAGRATYRLRLVKLASIVPNPSMKAIKITHRTTAIGRG